MYLIDGFRSTDLYPIMGFRIESRILERAFEQDGMNHAKIQEKQVFQSQCVLYGRHVDLDTQIERKRRAKHLRSMLIQD